MLIRKTLMSEIDTVMSLYESGRNYMVENGNTFQWQNGYPGRELIEEDINNGSSYIIEYDGKICGVFAMFSGIDATYTKIYDGSWLNNEPYLTIHRISIVTHGKGIATFVYKWALTMCDNIRIDTHRKNIPMQNSLKKNGFVYCGIIYLQSGDERLAFQLKKENFNY